MEKLFDAIIEGDTDQIEKLIKENSTFERVENYVELLSVALENNKIDIIQFLIDRFDKVPGGLYYAFIKRNWAVLKEKTILFSLSEWINLKDASRENFVCHVMWNQDESLLEKLVELEDVEFSNIDINYSSAMEIALKSQWNQGAEILMANFPQEYSLDWVDSQGKSIIDHAISLESEVLFDKALEFGLSDEFTERDYLESLLSRVFESEWMKGVELLLEHLPSKIITQWKDKKGRNILHNMLGVEGEEGLLEKIFDLDDLPFEEKDKYKLTALDLAFRDDMYDELSEYLGYYPEAIASEWINSSEGEINEEMEPFLFLFLDSCLKRGGIRSFKEVIEIFEVDLTVKNSQNKNLIEVALESGNYDLFEMLFPKFSNVIDESGDTLLHKAVKGEQARIAGFLLRNRFSITKKNLEDDSPLKLAIDSKDKATRSSFVIFLKYVVIQCGVNKFIELKDEARSNEWMIIVYKLLTTLLYKCKRYAWNDAETIKLKQFIFMACAICQLLEIYPKKATIISNLVENPNGENSLKELSKILEKAESINHNFYGSYLSDDGSDSDKENAFQEKSNDEKTKIMNKENLDIKKTGGLELKKKLKKRKSEDDKKANKDSFVFSKNEKRTKIEFASPVNVESIQEDIQLYNEAIKNKKTRSEALKLLKNNTVFYVASYRGIHYGTQNWNQDSRGNDRKTDDIGKPVVSASILAEHGLYPPRLFYSKTESERAQLYEELLKTSGQLKDLLCKARSIGPVVYNQYQYTSLAEALQDIYTKDDKKFYEIIKDENFNLLLNDKNPFVSTSCYPFHAARYALGLKVFTDKGKSDAKKEERLRPRYLKNGQAERPYSGKVSVFLHTLSELNDKNGPLEVVSLNNNGNLKIMNNIVAEAERTFPAIVNGANVIAHHKARYPNFHKPYKIHYLQKYGLDEELYGLFQKAICISPPHSEGAKYYKRLLGEWLCVYLEVKMIHEANISAQEKGGTLVYLKADGTISLEPDVSEDIAAAPSGKSDKKVEKRNTLNFKKKMRECMAEYCLNSKISPKKYLDKKKEFSLIDNDQVEKMRDMFKDIFKDEYLEVEDLNSKPIEKPAMNPSSMSDVLENKESKENEETKETTKRNVNLGRWYDDRDINLCLEKKVATLGGYAPKYHFLLKEKQNVYNVALMPAIDCTSHASPIDFYFDKSKQQVPQARDDRRDVFDEIKDLFSEKIARVKIIFPYNLTLSHWMTGEIVIYKNNKRFTVEIYTHDPYGGGKASSSAFKKIEAALTKRIKELQPDADVNCKLEKSRFGRRQAAHDSASCGVITVEDIIKRIKCASLDIKPPYSVGAAELREAHLNLMDGKSVDEKSFVERNVVQKPDTSSKPKASDDVSMASQIKEGYKKNVGNLIRNIQDPKLNKLIIENICNVKSAKEDSILYLTKIKSVLIDISPYRSSIDEPLNEKDVESINKLYWEFFVNKEGMQSNQNNFMNLAKYLSEVPTLSFSSPKPPEKMRTNDIPKTAGKIRVWRPTLT